MHHADPVGEDDRLVDVVGDEQDRLAGRAADAHQLALHVGAGVGVERRERLVHQQHLRLVGQHAGDLDALLHAAGQLGRMLVVLAAQADQLEIVPRLLLALGAAATPRMRRPNSTLPSADSQP